MAKGPGHFYFTKYALDSVKRIEANDFEWAGGPGGIIFYGLTLIDEKLRLYGGLRPHSLALERRNVGIIPPLTVDGLQARLRFTPSGVSTTPWPGQKSRLISGNCLR